VEGAADTVSTLRAAWECCYGEMDGVLLYGFKSGCLTKFDLEVKMNKLLIAILFLVVPLSAVADEKCDFPADMVKQLPPPNLTTVAAYQWDTGHDKENRKDQLQTLRILYKNGDIAVIRHRHCFFYSLEINYFRNSLADDLDAKALATLMADLYAQYFSAPQKVTFKKPMVESIASTFKEQKFDKKKSFAAELPEGNASYPDPEQQVSYSIVYKYHRDDYSESLSGIFSSTTRFEMSIATGGG